MYVSWIKLPENEDSGQTEYTDFTQSISWIVMEEGEKKIDTGTKQRLAEFGINTGIQKRGGWPIILCRISTKSK